MAKTKITADKTATIDPKEAERLLEMYGEEELDPELKEALVEYDSGFIFIKHPLVNVHYFGEQMHKMYNKQLHAKREYLNLKIADECWSSVLSITERPFRWDAFDEHKDNMSDEEYWDNLAFVWTDTENLWQHFHLALDLMESDRPCREKLMNEDELKALAKLPEEFMIYRGWSYDDGEYGLSWTLDEERAKWFGRRFCEHKGTARVSTAGVNKKDVLAHFLGRSEDEIVVNPDNLNWGEQYDVD